MSEEEKILNVFENTGDFGNYFLGDYSNLDIAKFIRKILKQNVDLQQELTKYKERCEQAIILTKKIKDDIWERMSEYYEEDDCWNGDFLNIRINSIDRLLETLEDKEKK